MDHDGAKIAQDGGKMSQNDAKMVSDWSMITSILPKKRQYDLRWGQEWRQDGVKMDHDGAKIAQDGAKMRQRSSHIAPNVAK